MEFQYICQGYPWMDPPVWAGKICPLLPFPPSDYEVRARGSSFHMIIGEHSGGSYLCIPDWGIGMDLAKDGNRKRNLEQLLKKYPRIQSVDAVSIVDAVTAIVERNMEH